MRSILLLLLIPVSVYSQINVKDGIKKTFKFATFYGAYNGNNSISDISKFTNSYHLPKNKTEKVVKSQFKINQIVD